MRSSARSFTTTARSTTGTPPASTTSLASTCSRTRIDGQAKRGALSGDGAPVGALLGPAPDLGLVGTEPGFVAALAPASTFGLTDAALDFAALAPASTLGLGEAALDFAAFAPASTLGLGEAALDFAAFAPDSTFGLADAALDFAAFAPVSTVGRAGEEPAFAAFAPTSPFGLTDAALDFAAFAPVSTVGRAGEEPAFAALAPACAFGLADAVLAPSSGLEFTGAACTAATLSSTSAANTDLTAPALRPATGSAGPRCTGDSGSAH
ncbi:hypothetical protein HUA75_32465 [Myxococcus sp. CA040A]|nr:hypothetical protein [Myxococcus sp. CA040A]